MSNKSVKPRKKTQVQLVKEYLQKGNTLTTYEAFLKFDITALNQRITDLRRKGYIIDSTPIEYNGRQFVSYSWNDDNPPEEAPNEPALTATAPAGAYHEE